MSAEDIVSSPRCWRGRDADRSTSPHSFPPDSEDEDSLSSSPPPHPFSMHADREWWDSQRGPRSAGIGPGRKLSGGGSPLMSLSRTAPDHAPSQPQTQLPCAECDRGGWALLYCGDCDALLCSACSDQHRWQKRTRAHTLQTLQEGMLIGKGKGDGHARATEGEHAVKGDAGGWDSAEQAKQQQQADSTANKSGPCVRAGALGGRVRGQRRLPSMENVLHAAAGVETTAVVPASGGGSRAGVGGGRTDLLWRLMAECIADDKETIQREVVRHVEYTLACTRLSFQKKHAFQAVAHSLRDRMVERFNDTEQFFEETGARRLYYLSLEFLMGRALSNGVYCLGLVGAYREALLELGFRLEDLYEEEKDAALGNGGLGRLAACFMDSLATLNYPASGYGLRYSYGLFEQRVMRNEQIELPDCWLTDGNPWEVERLDVQYTIRFYGNVRHMHQPRRDSRESLNGRGGGQAAGGGAYSHSRSRHSHSSFLTHAVSNYSGSPVHSPERDGRAREGGAGNESGCDGGGLREHRAVWEGGDLVQAVAFDTLIPGHGTRNTLNLRLWASRPTRELEVDMTLFNMGDYQGALEARQKSENITSVLYPNDSSDAGKELRLKQQYFLVAATMHDLLARYKKSRRPLIDLAQHVVVQLNDTHPALGIVELLRQLIDEEGLSWHKAWGIVTAVFNYTNHTVLPEALEKWPVTLLDKVLPRHMELIWEINHRFLKLVRTALPLEDALVAAMSIIEEHNEKGEKHADKLVRMAHLAVIGSRRVNGVAEMHTEILKRTVLEDFARLWPSKIMNITNGVTPRRWLFQANPLLTDLINKLVTGASSSPSGNAPFGVAQDFSQITKLRDLVHDSKALEMWRSVRRANKLRLAHLIEELTGTVLDPNMLFDVQVKRIHEYKRQVLNVLGIIHRHTELRRMRRDAPGLLGAVVPRAVIFSGKAAPGYAMAKLLIKLILHVAQVVNADKDTNHFLKVVFIPNYNVKYAEVIIPGADLSQHLSTAGKEASGTSNMKFSMNGCLLLASLDGSTAEICREVGEERVFIFGTRAEWVDEVRQRQHWPDYKVDWRFNNALDRLRGGDFGEPGLWAPLLETLRPANDQFLVGADFGSYLEAQARVDRTFQDADEWCRLSMLCCAGMASFSSDRSIQEYARSIWEIQPHALDADPADEACVGGQVAAGHGKGQGGDKQEEE